MKQIHKILVVDDEKIVRESLFHWFEDEGYSVDTAKDAVDALKQFDKGKYDLILLDSGNHFSSEVFFSFSYNSQ